MVKSGPWGLVCSLVILVGFISSAARASQDDSTAPGASGNCNPCAQAPPPPPVPCPPPPSHKKPPTPSIYNYPPRPSTYIYIPGPPGNLYPVEQYISGAEKGLARGGWVWIVIGVMFLW